MSHDCSESTTTSCMRSEIDGAGMASTAQAKELVALGGDSCTAGHGHRDSGAGEHGRKREAGVRRTFVSQATVVPRESLENNLW